MRFARGSPRASTLQSALEALDQALASGGKGRILKAIRPVLDQCQQVSPGRLESLRQHISVRCAVADLDPAKVVAAMGGPSRHDATFLRLLARGMEESQNPEQVVLACSMWENFRHEGVQEGWFAANGPEAAALSLHIADLLRRLPDGLLRELQASAWSRSKTSGEKTPYLFPEEMYQRACALDPHPETFAQWMDWAGRQRGDQAARVAQAWHKIRPRDIEPVLRLLKDAEARGAFGSALGYLAKVEQIDGLHPAARGARLRLVAGSALRHLQQKKPALAAEDLAEMSTLPQAQQGDGPAFLAALRFVVSAACGHSEQAATSRADVERLLGSGAAAAMLLFAVATASKQRAFGQLGSVQELSRTERETMDPIEVLGISQNATDEEIRAAYLLKVRECPPDRAPEKFEKIATRTRFFATPAGVCATACFPPIPEHRSRRSSLTRCVRGGSSATVHGWRC